MPDADEEETKGEEEELTEPEEPEKKIKKEMESSDVALAQNLRVVCSDDLALMNIEGVEIRQVEGKGGFLGLGSSEESHIHLKYKCPVCERYYYQDIEAKRQGCFIATAAYGTPLAGEINVLRRFRDSYLLQRKWGQKFVEFYYTVSPPIAGVIRKSESLKKIVRTLLKPIIKIFE